MSLVIFDDTRLIFKNELYFYILTMIKIEIKNNYNIKYIKYLGINLTK